MATFVLSGITGCGGGKNAIPANSGGGFSFTGAEASLGYSSTSAVVPVTGGASITASGYSGTTIVPSGVLPAGTTLGTDTPYAIIPAGIGFAGTILSGQGVTVNGVTTSGATVGSNGLLLQNVAIPVTEAGTPVTMTFPAQDVTLSRVLTIREISFAGSFYLLRNPVRIISPVPSDITGRIPNNGENAAGNSLTATWGAGNSGRTATLDIDYGTGFKLHQERVITNNKATFSNLTQDASNVPSSGIKSIKLSIGPR